MTLATALRLARISNVPTVWSNVIAAAAISGVPATSTIAALATAMSLLYVGGMFLNDAFDREIDGRERPSRPIPAGEAAPDMVFATGFGCLAAGVLGIAAVSPAAVPAAATLAGAIVLYDWFHKRNPLAPALMGFCRAMVYVVTAAALGAPLDANLLLPAAALAAYVAGLTYAARGEARNSLASAAPLALLAAPFVAAVGLYGISMPVLAFSMPLVAAIATALYFLRRRAAGDVPRAIGLLIAAIALCDSFAAASAGATAAAIVCAALFALTLALQRFVPGT